MDVKDTEIRYLGDVQRLHLDPCDVVVITASERINQANAEFMRDTLRGAFGNHRVVVLEKGMKIGVISEASV